MRRFDMTSIPFRSTYPVRKFNSMSARNQMLTPRAKNTAAADGCAGFDGSSRPKSAPHAPLSSGPKTTQTANNDVR